MERNVLIDEEIVLEIWNFGGLRCGEKKKEEKSINKRGGSRLVIALS